MLFMLARQLRLLQVRIQRPVAPTYIGAVNTPFHRKPVCGPAPFSSTSAQAACIPERSVEHEVDEYDETSGRETTEIGLDYNLRLIGEPQNLLSNYFSSPRETQEQSISTDQATPTQKPGPLDPSGRRPQTWQLNPQQLELESDVGHNKNIGSKLVDDARYSRDFTLWKELLLYRQRHYGDDGVIHVWKGLTRRCSGVVLPTEGKVADFLWEAFVAVALKEDWMLRELQAHAETIWNDKGTRWGFFYERVIGAFVRMGNQSQALVWHQALKDPHLDGPKAILCVFENAMATREGLEIFQELCQLTDDHRIYASVIPLLWKQNNIQSALVMHDFLMRRGDVPSLKDVQPLMLHVEKYSTSQQQSHFISGLIKAGTLPPGATLDDPRWYLSQNKANTADIIDAETPTVKDDFGARLFATKTFTFDLILGGLKVFGVRAIGPLTLREMALRAADITEIQHHLSAMREAGISTGNSVFAKVFDHLISRKDQRSLQDLIHSDQHPDVLESLETQESLLHHYSLSHDWRRANLTLTVLSFLSREDPHSYNVQLRNALKLDDKRLITETLDKMKNKRISPSTKTIKWMIWNMLPSHRIGTRPILDKASREAVLRLFGIFQYVIKYGGHIPPESWKAGLKQLITSHRWSEVERLCLWLAEAYSPKNNLPDSDIKNTQLPASHPQCPLRIIFSAEFQRAIIACGFLRKPEFNFSGAPTMNPYSPTPEPVVLWICGLILLRRLKEKGVHVQTATVQRECRVRLATLFGDGHPSNRKSNLLLRKANPWTLEKIITDAESVWGMPLFSEFGSNMDKLVNPRRRPFKAMDFGHKWQGKGRNNTVLGQPKG
ncbi:uncharacterized protein GIQ15_02950 [Arthroderma uncinatum]|uniref:uncharacterized protein n=1 Tax=Arthroderma uncinatum TaxID=74035 RepID=UPI00144A755F|nr:uncharacterized protein GIQ15_02950 [Arthroderma uncinatum]KAF3483626.1 hypothetical protein GIQ15_02950 [Arthroderma uncinatum]